MEEAKTVEEIFDDFKGRRDGFIKALITDAKILYEQCDPGQVNLCLYSTPDGTWEIKEPSEIVPPELPEPILGINFARDWMQRKAWLSLIAIHSDSWLLSLSFYFGAQSGITKNDRKRLFEMINEEPTLYEVVKEGKKPSDENACGVCDVIDNGVDGFWIWCHDCRRWFHGTCVNVTPSESERITQYRCPDCCSKKKKKKKKRVS